MYCPWQLLLCFLIDEEPIKKSGEDTNGSNEVAENTEFANDGAMSPVKEQISSLWEALSQPSIYKPVLFIFLWQATPTADGASLYFLTNDIGFGPEFLGKVRVITAISSLFGVWLYNQYLRRVPIKDVLLWTSLISVPLGLTQLVVISHYNRELGIPDGVFVLGDDVILSILGEHELLLSMFEKTSFVILLRLQHYNLLQERSNSCPRWCLRTGCALLVLRQYCLLP